MSGSKRRAVRRSAEEWRAIVSRFERSGQTCETCEQLCLSEELAPSTFWFWRRKLLKVLAFDAGGYWIWAKRLEQGQFAAPGAGREGTVALTLTRTGLLALLEGTDIAVRRQRKRYRRAA